MMIAPDKGYIPTYTRTDITPCMMLLDLEQTTAYTGQVMDFTPDYSILWISGLFFV